MTAMRPLVVLLVSFVMPVAAQAQVIEIGSSGEARTYASPTLFMGGDPVPIEAVRRGAPPSSGAISSILAAEARNQGLDQSLLEAVAWQESRGRMAAVSVKGARGVMQLMPSTAADLGVDLDDPAANIRGGALYLRRQLDRFGSVPLALAAYNAGPGAVTRYGGIPPYRETRNYVANILSRWRVVSSARPASTIPTEVSR